jgi:hypothetical protein
VAARDGKKAAAENAKIHSKVSLGHPEGLDGFGLSIELAVEGVEDSALIAAAHEVSWSLNTMNARTQLVGHSSAHIAVWSSMACKLTLKSSEEVFFFAVLDVMLYSTGT